MRLQGLGVLFALIVLPIILVLTYYIQLQVDTINLQNQYDSKLLKSTYDAMSAFEINTANEQLSSVSDSLRTIIEASTNVFFSTMATNFGISNASKSYVEPYVPAILYTLYDGYYINSPTKVPIVLTDSEGNAVSVGDKGVTKEGDHYKYVSNDKYLSYDDLEEQNKLDYGQLLYYLGNDTSDSKYTADITKAKFETKNVLKTYMPYSARYINETNKIDVTIIYTLDNYITVEGTINEIYYTKSGYLLPYQDTSNIELFDSNNNKLDLDSSNYNQNDVQEYIEQGNQFTVTLPDSNNKITIISDAGEEKKALEEQLIENPTDNDIQYKLDKMSAVVYYTKAKIFSDWVYENLTDIRESDLVEISGIKYQSINGEEDTTHNFNSDMHIFNTSENSENRIGEFAKDSSFYNHKLNVIKNSIQYNLNLAMSTYNANVSSIASDYAMPVISDEEWDKILTNVSIVSFMQGYSCGLKTYNNYKIVSSINNEISVDKDYIYYVKKGDFNNQSTEYHKIDCEKLLNNCTGINDEYIAFTSKEVKYDKIYDDTNSKYNYDHQNIACYDCINDGNYTSSDIFVDNDGDNIDTKKKKQSLRTAYYIGVAKCRNNLYKMNAVENSQGYEIVTDELNEKSIKFSTVKALEITYQGLIDNEESSTALFSCDIYDGSTKLNTESVLFVNNSANINTVIINLDSDVTGEDVFSKLVFQRIKSEDVHVDITGKIQDRIIRC